jgi:hypothetical protein
MQIERRKFKDLIDYGYYQGNEFIHHREDGPAIEYVNGDVCWYVHGLLHRDDGPALEYASGHKSWYLHGKRHREDGPAIEWKSNSWYLKGKEIEEEDFEEAVKIYKIKKLCK